MHTVNNASCWTREMTTVYAKSFLNGMQKKHSPITTSIHHSWMLLQLLLLQTRTATILTTNNRDGSGWTSLMMMSISRRWRECGRAWIVVSTSEWGNRTCCNLQALRWTNAHTRWNVRVRVRVCMGEFALRIHLQHWSKAFACRISKYDGTSIVLQQQ